MVTLCKGHESHEKQATEASHDKEGSMGVGVGGMMRAKKATESAQQGKARERDKAVQALSVQEKMCGQEQDGKEQKNRKPAENKKGKNNNMLIDNKSQHSNDKWTLSLFQDHP